MEQQAIATAAEIGTDTLADRVVKDVAAGGGIVIGRAEIGAWAQV